MIAPTYYIDLSTENCIVCLKPLSPATADYSGHVVAKDCFDTRLGITAGRHPRCEFPPQDPDGCYGPWRPEYGVVLGDHWGGE